MYKLILKIFAAVVFFLATMNSMTYALLLADKNSDAAVLGAIGIIFLVILANVLAVQILFGKKPTRCKHDVWKGDFCYECNKPKKEK